MSYNGGQFVRSRQPTLPPISIRTLHHPSFLPLYMTADFTHRHHCNKQPVHPIIPAEFFYTDPTMSRGRRISNIVSDLRVLDCFQLNTPLPVMSACPARPACPVPFRSGLHPTRDLGSLTFNITPLHTPAQTNLVVLQLTQEEDQAITNLLKLHQQEPTQSDDTLTAPQTDSSCHLEPMEATSAEEVFKPLCNDVQYPRRAGLQGQMKQGGCWSDMELEAADTLLSCFSLMEKNQFCGQNHSISAATFPGHPPQQCREITDRTPKDTSYRSSGDLSGCGALSLPLRPPSLSPDPEVKSRSSVFEVKNQTLSDSEGDAVHVLLSLSVFVKE